MTSKVIILTGASRGIGLAIAHFLLQAPQSCRVLVVSRSEAPLRELEAQYPSQVKVLAGDVADYSIAKRAVHEVTSAWGRLDSLILNHGVLEPATRVADSSAEEWAKNFSINFFSCVEFAKQALPYLRTSKGRIVFTSTGAASKPYAAWGAYGSSKAALNHLATTLAKEEPEVTSIAIRPGVVGTQMQTDLRQIHHSNMDRADVEKFMELYRTGALLKPELPGHVMARLALGGGHELSGKYMNWDDKELAAFQDK